MEEAIAGGNHGKRDSSAMWMVAGRKKFLETFDKSPYNKPIPSIEVISIMLYGNGNPGPETRYLE